MKKRLYLRFPSILCCLLLLMDGPPFLLAEPTPTAVAAFNAYSRAVEFRLAQQHSTPNSFLAPAGANPQEAETRLHHGELLIDRITPPNANLSGALLHHWRGTAFAPGATADDFLRLLRNFNSYPKIFSPQVLQARVLTQSGDNMQAFMRVRQQHVITVIMDTNYDITYGHLDNHHAYSISRSTHIDEIENSGTPNERALSASEERGFLWRLNTYWSYEERDGGLYLQVEAITLTRSIPTGIGWAVRPYIESVPRDSLEFTLRSACNALQR